jgi:hypothetical protein
MRSRLLSPLLLLLALAALGAPAAAPAQQTPRLGSPSPEETTAAPATTSDTTDEGLDTWQQALIFAAGVVLLAGIAAAIVGDARRRAGRGGYRGRAARDARGRLRAGEDRAADHRHRQAGKQRARERSRAARAARKRNR